MKKTQTDRAVKSKAYLEKQLELSQSLEVERITAALIKKDIKCIPQYPVAGRRLDLALVSKNIKIDIEVDSDRYHRNPDGSRKKDDTWRDIQLMGMGWKVMRFWVYNLRDSMGKCVSQIEKAWRNHE